jgi:hypothetical protein
MTAPTTHSVSPANSPVIPALPRSVDELPANARGPWLAAVLLLAFVLRATDPLFNTPFEDESFMVLMGRSILAGASDVAIYMRTAFGWYLWPSAAAIADSLGGLLALRLLAASLGTLAVYGLYRFTRTLFDTRTGLVAACLFACKTPAILTSRLATHDAASVPLLVFGLAFFAQAARGGRVPDWIWSALLCFAAFSVKHPMAAFFPGLCIAALALGGWGGVVFSAVLSALVGGYALYYRETILALMQFVSSFAAFRAPNAQLLTIYLWNRLDLWVVVAFALVAVMRGDRRRRTTVLLLFLGAATFAAVHVSRRLDYHTWKHTVYLLIFLVPAAAASMVAFADRLARADRGAPALAVLLMCALLYAAGRRGLLPVHGGMPFTWPNTARIGDFLAPRLGDRSRVLVDDPSVRYALRNALPQPQIIDQYWFDYQGTSAPASFGRGVSDGMFDYVVFAGSSSGPATALMNAVRPVLDRRYALVFAETQPENGLPIEIYERTNPAPPQQGHTHLSIAAPVAGQTVVVGGPAPEVLVSGTIRNVPVGSTVQVDVFTDRWYPQGRVGPLLGTSFDFNVPVRLSGQGPHRCHHLIRIRATDVVDRLLDEVMIRDVGRVSPDSLAVACPPQ